MISLNKWNQREVYSKNLKIDFHVTWQIIDYPLKLMEICSRILGLFMTCFLI
jgi:hypothetical protein